MSKTFLEDALETVEQMEFSPGTVWTLGEVGGSIRAARRGSALNHCPLTAWAHEAKGYACLPMQWHHAAQKMGVNLQAARLVQRAADRMPKHNPEIRRALLVKCGLEGERANVIQVLEATA